MEEKIIGICGGVGPEAGTLLHKMIIKNTLSAGIDQGHIEVHHLSRSNDVADRNNFLLKKSSKNPADGVCRTIEILEASTKILNKKIVIGIPCNAIHCLEIFDTIENFIKKTGSEVDLLNMVEETGEFVTQQYPNMKKIGLMSTTGTRKSGIYKKLFTSLGIELLEVSEEYQELLNECILNREWGIKAISPPVEKVCRSFDKFISTLKEEGAEAVILGCTEIPLIFSCNKVCKIPLIDPVNILSRALIRNASKNKLKPYKK